MKSEESNEMLKHALAYHARGWKVIPVGPNKMPPYGFKWKKYKTEQITEKLILEWWTQYRGYGIALITGEGTGIIVLDFDTKHKRTPDELKIPHTVLSRTQRDGYHAFFKHPGFYVKGTKGIVWGEGIDIQGEGNLAVLAPTQGEHGIYRWENPPETTEIAELPAELIEAIQRKNTKISQTPLSGILGVVHDGRRNDAACRLIGTLLAKAPEEDWEVAWTLVETWNQRLVPPLEDKILHTKFEDIAASETAKRKSRGSDQAPISAQEVQNKLGRNIILPAMSMKELCELDLPPTDWDVEGLIEHGTPNMISAAPNQFKSWVLNHFAICIAKGVPVFDHFKTKQQSVMIVNEEDHVGQLKNRSQMLLSGGSDDLPIYWHIQEEIKFTDEIMDQLLIEAQALDVTFIMFDSLRALHDANENDSQEMQKVMNQLKRFTKAGITVFFTHHHRKENRTVGYKKSETGEESRGSSSINAAIHGHITCEPKTIEGEDKLIIAQRKLKCASKLPPFSVKIIKAATMDSIKFGYEGEYDENETAKEQTAQTILEILKGTKTWLSKKDFESQIKCSESTIRKALRILELERKIVGEGRSSLLKKNEQISYLDGSHQEKFYQVSKSEIVGQAPKAQPELDDF